MSRHLQFINFGGVALLAGLSLAQWRSNSHLNHKILQLEEDRQKIAVSLTTQETTAKGCAADLEAFRQQVTTAGTNLAELTRKQSSLETEKTRFQAENETLRLSLTNWVEAVEARNTRIQEMNGRLKDMVEKQNTTVSNFNKLAGKYGETVKLLNECTVLFNELVVKYNDLVKTNGSKSTSQ